MAPKTAAETRVTKKEQTDYFKEAASWDHDRISALQKSKRAAWLVAGAASALALLLGLGLLLLIPLKSVEPYVVRVDSTTGIVDQVVKLRDARESYDEVMTKFFLRRVVTLRETYTRAQLQSNYDQSVLFTAPAARPMLKADFSFDNPNGPYKRYGEQGTASLQILNISFVARNVGAGALRAQRAQGRRRRGAEPLGRDDRVPLRLAARQRGRPRRQPAGVSGDELPQRPGVAGRGGQAMKRVLMAAAIGVALVATSSPGQAAEVPPPGTLDFRVRQVVYNEGQVYRLTGLLRLPRHRPVRPRRAC